MSHERIKKTTGALHCICVFVCTHCVHCRKVLCIFSFGYILSRVLVSPRLYKNRTNFLRKWPLLPVLRRRELPMVRIKRTIIFRDSSIKLKKTNNNTKKMQINYTWRNKKNKLSETRKILIFILDKASRDTFFILRLT